MSDGGNNRGTPNLSGLTEEVLRGIQNLTLNDTTGTLTGNNPGTIKRDSSTKDAKRDVLEPFEAKDKFQVVITEAGNLNGEGFRNVVKAACHYAQISPLVMETSVTQEEVTRVTTRFDFSTILDIGKFVFDDQSEDLSGDEYVTTDDGLKRKVFEVGQKLVYLDGKKVIELQGDILQRYKQSVASGSGKTPVDRAFDYYCEMNGCLEGFEFWDKYIVNFKTFNDVEVVSKTIAKYYRSVALARNPEILKKIIEAAPKWAQVRVENYQDIKSVVEVIARTLDSAVMDRYVELYFKLATKIQEYKRLTKLETREEVMTRINEVDHILNEKHKLEAKYPHISEALEQYVMYMVVMNGVSPSTTKPRDDFAKLKRGEKLDYDVQKYWNDETLEMTWEKGFTRIQVNRIEGAVVTGGNSSEHTANKSSSKTVEVESNRGGSKHGGKRIDAKKFTGSEKALRKKYILEGCSDSDKQAYIKKGYFKPGGLLDKNSDSFKEVVKSLKAAGKLAANEEDTQGEAKVSEESENGKTKGTSNNFQAKVRGSFGHLIGCAMPSVQDTSAKDLMGSSPQKILEGLYEKLVDKEKKEDYITDLLVLGSAIPGTPLPRVEGDLGMHSVGEFNHTSIVKASEFKGNEFLVDTGCTHYLCGDNDRWHEPPKVADYPLELLRPGEAPGQGTLLKLKGRIKVAEVYGREVFLDDVWYYPEIEGVYLPGIVFRENPNFRYTVQGGESAADITLQPTDEEIAANKPLVHFKVRVNEDKTLEFVDFSQTYIETDGKKTELGTARLNRIKTDTVKNLIYEYHKISHMNFADMLAAIRRGTTIYHPSLNSESVKGMVGSDFHCIDCDRAKIVDSTYRSSARRAKKPGELLHADLHVSPPVSRDGYRYYVVFVDDYTRFIWAKPLLNKSDCLKEFAYLRAYIERQFESPVKTLRTDKGEFRGLDTQLKGLGIVHEYSAEYAHQQNGTAERAIRTVTTRTRASMLAAGANPELWQYAIHHVVSAINMEQIRNIDGKEMTAYQALFGRVPDMSRYKPFGVDCIVRVPPEKLQRIYQSDKSFVPRGHRCIYLGEDPLSKASIVYDCEVHKVWTGVTVKEVHNSFEFMKLYKPKDPKFKGIGGGSYVPVKASSRNDDFVLRDVWKNFSLDDFGENGEPYDEPVNWEPTFSEDRVFENHGIVEGKPVKLGTETLQSSSQESNRPTVIVNVNNSQPRVTERVLSPPPASERIVRIQEEHSDRVQEENKLTELKEKVIDSENIDEDDEMSDYSGSESDNEGTVKEVLDTEMEDAGELEENTSDSGTMVLNNAGESMDISREVTEVVNAETPDNSGVPGLSQAEKALGIEGSKDLVVASRDVTVSGNVDQGTAQDGNIVSDQEELKSAVVPYKDSEANSDALVLLKDMDDSETKLVPYQEENEVDRDNNTHFYDHQAWSRDQQEAVYQFLKRAERADERKRMLINDIDRAFAKPSELSEEGRKFQKALPEEPEQLLLKDTPEAEEEEEEEAASSSRRPRRSRKPEGYYRLLAGMTERAPKRKGNFNAISNEKILGVNVDVPVTLKGVANAEYRTFWEVAIANEMKSLTDKKVMEEVDLDKIGKVKIVDTRFVFAIKTDINGYVNRFKARLVAKGFSQTEGVDFDEVYAPVVAIHDIRLLLGLAVVRDMVVMTFDVKTAFLNAPLDHTIYIKMPKGSNDLDSKGRTKVYKLNKALYGLKQAPKQWFEEFMETIAKLGFTQTLMSPNVCTRGFGSNQVIIAVYVDDTLVMGQNKDIVEDVIDQIRSVYETDEPSYINKFLGLNIHYDTAGHNIKISGKEYIERVAVKLNLVDVMPRKTPMAVNRVLNNPPEAENRRLSKKQHHDYRSLVGSLRYLATVARPDICNATRRLSHYLNEPTLFHWRLAVELFGYVYHTRDYAIGFDKNRDTELYAYADAAFSIEDEDLSSVGGGIIFYGGGPIYWFSKRQNTVVHGVMDSEIIALDMVVSAILRYRILLHELDSPLYKPTVIYEDNAGALASLLNKADVTYGGYKGLARKFKDLKTHMREKYFDLQKVDTKDQLADFLTKSFSHQKMKIVLDRLFCTELGNSQNSSK